MINNNNNNNNSSSNNNSNSPFNQNTESNRDNRRKSTDLLGLFSISPSRDKESAGGHLNSDTFKSQSQVSSPSPNSETVGKH